MPEGLPHNPFFLSDLQPVARASAALPAAGAWDAAPTAFFTSGMDYARIVCTYTRGAAGGAFEMAIQTNGFSTGTAWERTTLYDPAAVALNTDSQSNIQREGLEYGATAAAAESVTYGPLALLGTVEQMRIAARETGVVGTPGILAIQVFLT